MLSTIIKDMPDTSTSLADYLKAVLEERDLSIRALATYAGLSHSTVRRMLAGQAVDNQTLIALANYLNLSVEVVYQMAGTLPEPSSVRSAVLNEIENMLLDLPEEAQKKIRDQIRVEWEYNRVNRDVEQTDDVPKARKAS